MVQYFGMLCTHTLHVTGKHHRCRHTQHMFILPVPGSIAFALRVFQSSKAGTSRALNTTYLQTLSLASAFEPKMQVTKRIPAKFELCTGVPFFKPPEVAELKGGFVLLVNVT